MNHEDTMGNNGGKREGAGRPAGSKDKITKDLKQLVLDTAEALTKDDKSLLDEAKKDPKWFYGNFVKPMLPKEVKAELSGDLTVILKRYSEESE